MKLLLLLLISFSAFGRDLHMTEVRDSCESVDWSRRQCQFLADDPNGMDYENERFSTTAIVDLGGMLGALTEQLENINNQELSCLGSGSRLTRLVGYTRNIVRRRPLSDCQKACVVKCITANYITYGDTGETGINQDSACQAANKGRGVCRAFANLGYHLMTSVGLRADTSSNSHHSYNKVHLRGRWYYSEPQDEACRFSVK